MAEQADTLRQALQTAYLRHVKIAYAGGTVRTGYISFGGTFGGPPIIKRRFEDSHGALLPLDGITRFEWGTNVLYSTETD